MTYSCGCAVDGSTRCDQHRYSPCHYAPHRETAQRDDECPPCRRARWLSVGNAFTPTRTFQPSKETLSLEGIRHGQGK